MCKKFCLKDLMSFLSNHLELLEQEKDMLLRKYYSENVEECMNVEDFFREYKNSITDFINSSQLNSSDIKGFPFVIIRSIVEVQDMNDLETYQYHIIPPFLKKPDMNIDCASCLSPLGKALLLKRIDQQVDVQIPAGRLQYKVKKIIIPEMINSKMEKTLDNSENMYLNNLSLTI